MDYVSCVAVQKAEAMSSGMTACDIPANTYAVIDTTLIEERTALDFFFGTWLPASGRELAAGPHFEYYNEEFKGEDPASIVSVHIPVK